MQRLLYHKAGTIPLKDFSSFILWPNSAVFLFFFIIIIIITILNTKVPLMFQANL